MCFVQLRIDYKILEIILHEFNAIETRTRYAMLCHAMLLHLRQRSEQNNHVITFAFKMLEINRGSTKCIKNMNKVRNEDEVN